MKPKQIYIQLKKEFLTLGGSQSFIDKLPPVYSLQNEAKLRFEIRKLKSPLTPKRGTISTKSINAYQVLQNKYEELKEDNEYLKSEYEELEFENEELKSPPAPKGGVAQTPPLGAGGLGAVGFISEYPLELHKLYLKRKQQFITACSLKVQLNSFSETDTEKAYALQLKIMKCFDFVDDANKKLNHYREFKRILPTATKEDFTKLSKPALIQRRNTLRSNISNRAKTIEKIKKTLETATQKNKLRIQNKLSTKIEELEELKLQVNELNNLI